jgi:hypothetical protein
MRYHEVTSEKGSRHERFQAMLGRLRSEAEADYAEKYAFQVAAQILMEVNLASAVDDQRRAGAERWCRRSCHARWRRHVDRDANTVLFEFEDKADAALFATFHERAQVA